LSSTVFPEKRFTCSAYQHERDWETHVGAVELRIPSSKREATSQLFSRANTYCVPSYGRSATLMHLRPAMSNYRLTVIARCGGILVRGVLHAV
jgi:hypothetical protein